jgi:cytidylate kinase
MRTTITITRQMGSAGSYLGQLIAQNLNFRYIDHEILQLAAREFGVEPSVLTPRAEKISSFWQRTLHGLTFGSPESYYAPPSLPILTDQSLFKKQTEIMTNLAKEYNCVIVGWGSTFVLPRHSKMTTIFCHAPLTFRINRVMKVYQAPNKKSAEIMINESDKMRKKYIDRMIGKDWSCAENYDLSINTSLNSLEKMADIIIKFVKQKGK